MNSIRRRVPELLLSISRWVARFSAGLLLLNPSLVYAQPVITITDEPSCPDCVLDLRPVATLDPGEESGLRSFPPPDLTRLRDGSWVAGPMVGDRAIARFTPSGTLRDRYGRIGEGPEEFSALPFPMMIRVRDDDLVYVVQGPWIHLLDETATATKDKRSVPLRPNDAVVLGRTLVLQSPVHAPDGGGSPLQVVGPDGSIKAGIGITSARPMAPSGPFDGFRRIGLAGPDREDGLWSAYLNRYEMSRFGIDGREEARVVREADWFQPYEDALNGELFLVPQRPRIEGVRQDRDGLLWVVISHAPENFQPIEASGATEARIDPYVDMNRLLDTTIEVLDIESGEVVTRRIFESYLRLVHAPGGEILLMALTPDRWGALRAEVFSGAVRGR